MSTANDLPGSFRQALFDANALTGPDVVQFAPGLRGTISLYGQELSVQDAVAIEGPGANEITVDAMLLSRLFHIDDGDDNVTHDVMIAGLTITGGRSPGSGGSGGDGGGILSRERLTLADSVVTGNEARGQLLSRGGGIYAWNDLLIEGSTISNNLTVHMFVGGAVSQGGGIWAAGNLTISNSVVTGNLARGDHAGGGGGIDVRGDLVMEDSLVTDNETYGSGGGIRSLTNAEIRNSTVSNNRALGELADGGGIAADGAVSIEHSWISDNTTTGGGGGVFASGNLVMLRSHVEGNAAGGGPKGDKGGGGISVASGDIRTSTITGNVLSHSPLAGGAGILMATGSIRDSTISANSNEGVLIEQNATITSSTISGNTGAGIWAGRLGGVTGGASVTVRYSTITANLNRGIVGVNEPVASTIQIRSTIVAENLNGDVHFFASGPSGNPFVSQGYNLVGNGNGVSAFHTLGDQSNVAAPLLGPLADHGGSTWTHELLPGSPAINAGDPDAVPGVGTVPLYDQRGDGFGRIALGRIDIGAYERELLPITNGDFNHDLQWDIDDLDALIGAIASQSHDFRFDMTGDGLVNLNDRDEWLAVAGSINLASGNPYALGDANLDGVVDGSDFNIWNANKFTAVAAWSAADFDASGFVDGSDFSIWNANKFTSAFQLRSEGTQHLGERREGNFVVQLIGPHRALGDTEFDKLLCVFWKCSDGLCHLLDVSVG